MATVLLNRFTWRSVTLIAFESALIISALLASAYVRLGPDMWSVHTEPSLGMRVLAVTALIQLALYYNELYDLRTTRDRFDLTVRLAQSIGVASLFLGLLYFLVPTLILGRGVFMIAVPIVLTAVVIWRIGFEFVAGRMRARERILLVGTTQASIALANELLDRTDLGVSIVGFVDTEVHPEAPAHQTVIGHIDDIPRIVEEHEVDRVVVSLSEARGKLPMDRLLAMKIAGVRFDHLATVYEEYTGKIAIENLRPSWLIFSAGFDTSSFTAAVKRASDFVLASLMLVATAPLMAVTALLVRLTSPGPVIYSQTRVGFANRPFTIYKFRSMRVDAEATSGAVWAQKNDPRVTPVGRFLRKSRLDELPQLWNVVRGDMSFVGPRPERPSFVSELTQQIPFYGLRHSVKPGLTGWAQVRYAYGASVIDSMEKLQYDLFYIKHLSLMLDVVILIATVRTVILRKGN